jgi:hypothetical protein
VGRAPRSWTPEIVQLIKDNFVAVSAGNLDQNRQDAVGKFIRESGMKFPGAGGSVWCVTADGKLLGNGARVALQKWKALPESQRRPGAIKVEPMGEKDAKFAAPTPPEGALILRLYYRAFMREPDGKLRYVTGKDLWHDEKGERTEEGIESKYPGAITTPQAQPDHMWLTRTEWRSLVPARPRKGDSFPLPPAIADRLCRWHLNPLNVYGEANPLGKKEVRSSEITLTVTEVSDRTVRLRLDGSAKLGAPLPAADAGPIGYRDRWGYEPRLLGWLDYDREKQAFTRFEVAALGDHFGKLGIADSALRPGRQPLGIAFELAPPDCPADRIHPGRTSTAKSYFDPAR